MDAKTLLQIVVNAACRKNAAVTHIPGRWGSNAVYGHCVLVSHGRRIEIHIHNQKRDRLRMAMYAGGKRTEFLQPTKFAKAVLECVAM